MRKPELAKRLKSFKRAGSSSRTRVEGREAKAKGQECSEQTVELQKGDSGGKQHCPGRRVGSAAAVGITARSGSLEESFSWCVIEGTSFVTCLTHSYLRNSHCYIILPGESISIHQDQQREGGKEEKKEPSRVQHNSQRTWPKRRHYGIDRSCKSYNQESAFRPYLARVQANLAIGTLYNPGDRARLWPCLCPCDHRPCPHETQTKEHKR